MLEAILAFFAFGTWGFFAYLALLSVIFMVAVEKQVHKFAAVFTILGIALMWRPLLAALSHWQLVLIVALGYGIIGGAYSVWRLRKLAQKIMEEHPYAKRHSYEKDVPEEEYYYELCRPKHHKARLISWIVYWPWSLVWNITGDFFTGIYDMLATTYERTVRSVIRGAIKSNPTKA